jgi:hypothetical protein
LGRFRKARESKLNLTPRGNGAGRPDH